MILVRKEVLCCEFHQPCRGRESAACPYDIQVLHVGLDVGAVPSFLHFFLAICVLTLCLCPIDIRPKNMLN